MSKVAKALTGDKNRPEGLVIFYCKGKKAHQFSLPEYEVVDGKFVIDKGTRVPLYRFDKNGNNKAQRRKIFEFTDHVQFNRETCKPDMLNFQCKFEVTKDAPYRDDLLKHLNAASKDAGSSILSEDAYVKSLNPKAFEQAEIVQTMADKIKSLEDKVAGYEKKGK